MLLLLFLFFSYFIIFHIITVATLGVITRVMTGIDLVDTGKGDHFGDSCGIVGGMKWEWWKGNDWN